MLPGGECRSPKELLSHSTVICFVKNRLIGRRRAGTGAAAPLPCPVSCLTSAGNFSGLLWDWGNSLGGQFYKVLGNGDSGQSQGLLELEQPLGKEMHLGLSLI